MAGIIGKKVGMTSVFDAEGKNLPCTVIEAGPCVVTQVKTPEKDGYSALQLAYDDKKEKRTANSMIAHFKKANCSPKRKLVEFSDFEELKDKDFSLGALVTVDIFQEGEFVDVQGVTKGKGFQGPVRRHHFKGVGSATHGQHNRLRAPGSMGASSYPSRVFKGKKLGGRMGCDTITTINLKVIKLVPESNLIIVKGSVPGAKGSYLVIQK